MKQVELQSPEWLLLLDDYIAQGRPLNHAFVQAVELTRKEGWPHLHSATIFADIREGYCDATGWYCNPATGEFWKKGEALFTPLKKE